MLLVQRTPRKGGFVVFSRGHLSHTLLRLAQARIRHRAVFDLCAGGGTGIRVTEQPVLYAVRALGARTAILPAQLLDYRRAGIG